MAAAALAALAAGRMLTKRRRHAKTSAPRTFAPKPGKYPGDYQGKVAVEYAPDPDGDADPGEIVWTWVPYEEDHSKGKDRPVLLIGRDGKWLLGLMLTSKDHDNHRYGQNWLDIGAGDWDRQRRPSEVRLDRIIRVDPRSVRREGATVSKRVFDDVSHSLSSLHHW